MAKAKQDNNRFLTGSKARGGQFIGFVNIPAHTNDRKNKAHSEETELLLIYAH